MNKEDALKKVTEGEGDFHVVTMDEHKEFLNNLKNTDIFKQQIDGRVSEIYQQIDKDVLSITGNPKNTDEKTYDFVKRELTSYKDLHGELNTKNVALQKAVDDKSGGNEAYEQLKKEHDTVLQKHQDKMEEWAEKFEAKEKEGVKNKIKSQLDSATNKLKYLSTIPQEAVNGLVDVTKSKLADSAKLVENTVVYLDGKGEVRLDDMMRPLTTDFVVAEELKSIIDAGRQQPGVEIKEAVIEKDDDGKIKDIKLNIPDSVKTNVDLGEFLLKSGMKRGSKEFDAAYAKYREKLTIVT